MGFTPYQLLSFVVLVAFSLMIGYFMAGLYGIIMTSIFIFPIWVFMQRVRKENRYGRRNYIRELINNQKQPRYIKDSGEVLKYLIRT